MHKKRIEKLIQQLENDQIDLIAINASQSLAYFSGFHFHVSERPAVLLIGKGEAPAFNVTEFEHQKVDNAAFDFVPFAYPENPSTWGDVFKKALRYFKGYKSMIGVEPTAMRFLEINLLQLASAEIQFTSAAHIFRNLRMIKDNEEINSIRQAIQIAQTALENTVPFIRAGITILKSSY